MLDSKPEQDQKKEVQQNKNLDALLEKTKKQAQVDAKKPSTATAVLTEKEIAQAPIITDKVEAAFNPVVEQPVTNKPIEVTVLQETEKQRGVKLHIALPPNTFQYYNSAMKSLRMCTSAGVPINFKDFQLVTNDIDVIAYLEHELSKGLELQGITRGALMTKEEMDPMEILRKQHIADYIASEAAATATALAKEQDGSATGILTSGSVVTAQDSN